MKLWHVCVSGFLLGALLGVVPTEASAQHCAQ